MRGEIYTFHFNFQLKALMIIECKYIRNAIMIFTEKYKWCCHKKILHEIPKAANSVWFASHRQYTLTQQLWIALCIWIHLDTKTFYMNPFVKETISTLYRKLDDIRQFLVHTRNFFPPHNNCNCSTFSSFLLSLRSACSSTMHTQILINVWNETLTSKINRNKPGIHTQTEKWRKCLFCLCRLFNMHMNQLNQISTEEKCITEMIWSYYLIVMCRPQWLSEVSGHSG